VSPARSRSEQARRTRQAVLDTAIELFSERGYAATSLQMIADRMGVTKAAVYYHFRAKDDILEAISAPVWQQLTALLDEIETADGPGERLRRLTDGFVDILMSARPVITIVAGDKALTTKALTDKALTDKTPDDRPAAHPDGGLVDRVIKAVYGADPTPDQRATVYLAASLPDLIPAFASLGDAELRAVLTGLLDRLFPTPADIATKGRA
jgi:AcrR family transcriptional regulator